MSNANVVLNVRQVFDALQGQLNEELAAFAQFVEDFARSESESRWESDSGSARDSITAYEVEFGDHEKNFGADHWSAARTPGYTSPVWGNPAENFQPDVQDGDFEGEAGFVLTMFVPYAESLELGGNDRATLSGEAPIFQGPRQRRMERRPSLLSDVVDQKKEEFEQFVAQTIGSVLN